jgi:(S)-2-hydroxyglutarate dehydrogenase
MKIRADVAIIGGGIIGLAIGNELLSRRPSLDLVVIEKENRVAFHQSGRNSGVIHSGIYYRPGSIKARLGRQGCESMTSFCMRESIPHEICGKVIAAVDEEELGRLEELRDRAVANGVQARLLSAAEAREIEPALSCVGALHVPSTGIVDYVAVAQRLREKIEASGSRVLLDSRAGAISRSDGGRIVVAGDHEIDARLLVNAAGLHSDRVARRDGADPGARIVPFRGEYYELLPRARPLIRGMIYPVPDPRFPFLGVHLTRGVDGSVHAGPNAVLAFAREGYRWIDVSPRDLLETLRYGGFWKFAARNLSVGTGEIVRSLSRRRFAASLQRMVPAVREEDLVPAPAGVRAQALGHDGSLIDDFLLVERDGALHVCNAPSPAATASLEIAREIADRLAL